MFKPMHQTKETNLWSQIFATPLANKRCSRLLKNTYKAAKHRRNFVNREAYQFFNSNIGYKNTVKKNRGIILSSGFSQAMPILFDGLSGIVINELNGNPLSGDVYIFINKRRDRIKLLIWDRNGFWLLYKRLEEGLFQELFFQDSKGAYISYESLIMLLEGIDLNSVKRRKRYAK